MRLRKLEMSSSLVLFARMFFPNRVESLRIVRRALDEAFALQDERKRVAAGISTTKP